MVEEKFKAGGRSDGSSDDGTTAERELECGGSLTGELFLKEDGFVL